MISFGAATGVQYDENCPIALRIMACMLLLEITAYLRETFQNLPRSIRVAGRERPTAWEKSLLKDNRRFSVALSSMGHSQASAQSLQSIAGEREPSEFYFTFIFGCLLVGNFLVSSSSLSSSWCAVVVFVWTRVAVKVFRIETTFVPEAIKILVHLQCNRSVFC